jgi:hypothetical protein
MQDWIEKLIDREVTVMTRNDDTEHSGTLLAVDLTPQQHGLGPSAAIEAEDGTLTIAFDVDYIEENYEDDDDD